MKIIIALACIALAGCAGHARPYSYSAEVGQIDPRVYESAKQPYRSDVYRSKPDKQVNPDLSKHWQRRYNEYLEQHKRKLQKTSAYSPKTTVVGRVPKGHSIAEFNKAQDYNKSKPTIRRGDY